MFRTSDVALATLLIGSLLSTPSPATSLGIDDFQDGTTQGWVSGPPNPNPPIHVADGGPGGTGDGYLLVTAHGGVGAGSRMALYNNSQWTGDFLNSGILGLAMDVRNFARDPLELRIALTNEPTGGGAFATHQGVTVPGNSGWQSIFIPLTAGDLTNVGFETLEDTLTAVSRMRIIHNTQPSIAGLPFDGTLGIDNVRAVNIPEPSAWMLALFATPLFARRRSR